MLTPAQVKTAVLIGKYGACLPACSGSIITGHFNLAGCVTIIIPPVPPVFEGGVIPMAPGEIQNMYQPVADQPGWWTKQGEPGKPKQIIQVKIKIKDNEYEKYLMVTERGKNMAVTVANLVNSTQHRINVAIKGLKALPTRAVVTIKNFTKKWWN